MKLIRSFKYAWKGVEACFRSELNFRIHTIISVLVIIFAILFHISIMEWIATGFSIALVLVTEMINTAIEKLCDVVNKDIHPAIKQVKDISAGAVLIAAFFSVITGLLIFLPKIILLFKSSSS